MRTGRGIERLTRVEILSLGFGLALIAQGVILDNNWGFVVVGGLAFVIFAALRLQKSPAELASARRGGKLDPILRRALIRVTVMALVMTAAGIFCVAVPIPAGAVVAFISAGVWWFMVVVFARKAVQQRARRL